MPGSPLLPEEAHLPCLKKWRGRGVLRITSATGREYLHR